MDKYKKVNTEAVIAAVMQQRRQYRDTTCRQFKNIIYVEPHVFDFDVDEIVAISILLTRRWDEVSVTNPEVGDHMGYLRLVVGIRDLLPEFILEGEEWIEENDEDGDRHDDE